MMQVEYKLKLGQDEFTLKAEVKDEKDFFEQMSFYSNLPKTAPNGATDLKLVFRTTKKGHKYYSLISELEKQEFKLGQNLEANGGGLFPKGWEPLFEGNRDDDQGQAPAVHAPVQTRPAAPQAPVYQAPPVAPAVPNYGLPQPAAPLNANYPGMVNPVIGPTASAPVAAPQAPVAAAPVAAAPAPAAPAQTLPNPQTVQAAANVLARFGIKQ